MPNLETVTLPAGLTSIPKDAFANSVKLATVNFKAADANNGGSGPSAKDATGEANKITLPSGITSIGQNAFAGTKASTVDLSGVTAAGFTTIDNSVFKGMVSLTEVILPSSITQINNNAFQNDAALKKLTQADPTTGYGSVQARANEEDTAATFGSKLTRIGDNAFQGTGFTTVDLSKAVGTPATSSGTTPLTVGSNAFTNMANLETVKLPKDSNINPAYFGNPVPAEGTEQKLKTITYGTLLTDPAAFSGAGNTFSGTNYNKISNKTIDLTGYPNLTTLGTGVLFGNAAMTTLKMNAPIMSLSGSAVSVADPV